MTDFYILTNARGQTLGIFTSPEKAMEYVYLSEIYEILRGWKVAPDKFIWENDRDVNWYAHNPEDFKIDRMHRPVARYEIHIAILDWMGHVEDMVRALAAKFPSQSELMPVIAYGSVEKVKE